MKTLSTSEIPEFFNSFIEVEVPENKFLIIKETLTRIGVCPKVPKQDPILYQSCHILSYKGKYYIVHFKELFLLDGKEALMDELDFYRRNQIAKLLQDWGLLKIKNMEKLYLEDRFMKLVKIIPADEKDNWCLVSKYHLGRRKFLD